MSPGEWEAMVLEWATSLAAVYQRVDRVGGAGDMGCDIIGTLPPDPVDGSVSWDNYQCKHYDRPLQPTDVWPELGKLVYYTYQGKLAPPRRYIFVAPKGAGNTLTRLLADASALRQALVQNWDKYCGPKITSAGDIPLDDALRAYLDGFDFSTFEALPPLTLIRQHAQTPWHAARFGGGLPVRPPVPLPPDTPASLELVYIRELYRAYGDHLGARVSTSEDLASHADLLDHLLDSRREFYSAEALRAFSRDTLPPLAFEALQEEMHSGIKDAVRGSHDDGYARILAVVGVARALAITAHALSTALTIRDRGGICHQLVNDDVFKWVS